MWHSLIEAIFKEPVCLVVNSSCSIDLAHYVLETSWLAIDSLRLPDIDVDLIA